MDQTITAVVACHKVIWLVHFHCKVLEQKSQLRNETGQRFGDQKLDAAKEMKEAGGALRNGIHVMSRSLRQNPVTIDNLQKVQADRYVSLLDVWYQVSLDDSVYMINKHTDMLVDNTE